jgi:hypothetical protein
MLLLDKLGLHICLEVCFYPVLTFTVSSAVSTYSSRTRANEVLH